MNLGIVVCWERFPYYPILNYTLNCFHTITQTQAAAYEKNDNHIGIAVVCLE